MVFNPSADTTIRSEEKVIVVGSSDDLVRLEKALNP
jgi:K+/H+ antiporter YhaU regulatory subunit KhtT